jgi:hypothetical protein
MGRIAHLTNAISAIVGSETEPAKLVKAAQGLLACHVVTTIILLDTFSTLRTPFDAPPVLEALQQLDLFTLFCISIVLRARAIFMPLRPMRETGLALALVARHDGRIILAWVLLAVPTARPGTPSELCITL